MRRVTYQFFKGIVKTTSFDEAKEIERDYKLKADVVLEDIKEEVHIAPLQKKMLEQCGVARKGVLG